MKASPTLIYANYNVHKTVQPELHQTHCTRRTPVLKKLHWLPVEYHSVFKIVTLVYKFLHTVFFGVFCSIFLFV